MKFRTLKNWEDPKSLEGMVFFAQLIEELLFDYSIDTYKPSAMNTCTLCLEALRLIQDIENEVIDKNNLKHVLEEFVFCLKKDEVAKSLLNIKPITICSTLQNDDCSIQEKRTVLEITYLQINKESYKTKTEELLVEAIKDGNEKNRIRSLTRNYITTLISIGYSSKYLYPAFRKFFYWGEKGIKSTDDLKSAFSLVDNERQEYIAIFKAEKIFDEIKTSCKVFNITITKSLEGDILKYAKNKNFDLEEGQVYLVVDKFKSMDVFSARKISEQRIETISTLTNLFHHKEIPSWQPNALLINNSNNKSRLVSSFQNPMLMCSDLKTHDAAEKLNEFINNFSLSNKNSFQKFNRATELHSLALKNDSSENQLLNLWIGLETLSPSKLYKNKAKINNIIDSVLPLLTLGYLFTLTNRLTLDFKIWNRTLFNKSINKINGDDERGKLIKILLLDQHKDIKNELFTNLNDFHLLRNRAFYFSNCLSSPDKISKLLDTHWIRVSWQIRRIYRTRNLIVHAGRTPAYIDVLIKNTHDYLDAMINGVASLASNSSNVTTLEQAFKLSEIKYTEYMHELKSCKENINEGNIDLLVIKKRI